MLKANFFSSSSHCELLRFVIKSFSCIKDPFGTCYILLEKYLSQIKSQNYSPRSSQGLSIKLALNKDKSASYQVTRSLYKEGLCLIQGHTSHTQHSITRRRKGVKKTRTKEKKKGRIYEFFLGYFLSTRARKLGHILLLQIRNLLTSRRLNQGKGMIYLVGQIH